MKSAISFNLDESKILLSGNGLNKKSYPQFVSGPQTFVLLALKGQFSVCIFDEKC